MKINFKNPATMIVTLFVSAILGLIFSGQCIAASKYNGNYARCLASSGGRGGILSVQQACNWAANQNINGCSLWIGPATSSTVPEITVYSETGTAQIMYWGLCTDRVDKTSRVWVNNDNDAINDAMNVTRGVMPGVGGAPTTLDIARFIAGASKQQVSECEAKYTRTVMVGRSHSDGASSAEMPQTVTLRVISGEGCNEGNTCDDWKPGSYSGSNKWHGVTSIDIRIKNLAGRFGGAGFGAWNDNDIFAMPTDTISWIACYYPGVQYTHETDVGHLAGWYGYDPSPLPTDRCIADRSVTYRKLYEVYQSFYGKWENQFTMSGDGGYYFGEWTRGDTAVRQHIIEMGTAEGDAGKTFTEEAITGKPIEATISQDYPTSDFRACTCQNWSCVQAGWHDTSHWEGTPPNQTWKESGYWDSSRSYCAVDHYDFATCSCCTEDWGNDGFATQRSAGPTQKTGHVNRYEKTQNNATVSTGPASDALSVRLPYNFYTSTAVSINTNLVYSGHANAIRVNNVTTTVHTRYNSVTIADYATQVPGATINLFTYVTSSSNGNGLGGMITGSGNVCDTLGDDAKQCVFLMSTGRTLNAGGSLGGSTDTIWSGLTYNAFDASAGDYMCFASTVSPFSVSGDTDMSGGDGLWAYSEPKCAIIAKKPSFQVWGGSMYSIGNILSNYNSKVNIYNAYKSDVQSLWKRNGGTTIHFTPWVEEALILKNGTTNTVASGAASALNGNVAGVGTSTVFCNDRAALSFANYSGTIGSLCNGAGTVGASGISNGIVDRADLINYWVGTGAQAGVNTAAGRTFNLTYPNTVGQTIKSATGATVRYSYSNGDINIYGTVPQGTTYLIKSDGTVNITGDLRYNNSYTAFAQIPKVIIYARNVNISCSAGEVDAIIITGKGGSGHVNTCAGGGDVNSSARSRQLKIFGMVITDSIDLGRTYGSAANSGGRTDWVGTPSDGAAAEVFDYDSSILMWSEFMAGSNESDTLQTVYQHELAPRY